MSNQHKECMNFFGSAFFSEEQQCHRAEGKPVTALLFKGTLSLGVAEKQDTHSSSLINISRAIICIINSKTDFSF